MKALTRITLFLRHLAAHDSSFDKARAAADFALQSAIHANLITSHDVGHISVLLRPDIDRMCLTELAAEVRASLAAALVCQVRKTDPGPTQHEIFNSILEHLPQER